MRARLDQIVIDCIAPATLVRFWAGLLGGEPVDRAYDWSHVEPPGFPRISFQPVPEGSFQVMRDPEGNEFCFVTD